MSLNYIFCVLILSVAVMARPEEKPAGPNELSDLPPFVASVSAEGQKEFKKVLGNGDLTLAEVDARLAALAEKYKVSNEFKQFQESSAADLAKVKKQQKELIEKLSAVNEKLESIYANKNQTIAQQEEAVEAVAKSNQKIIPFISSSSETSRKIRLTLTCTISF